MLMKYKCDVFFFFFFRGTGGGFFWLHSGICVMPMEEDEDRILLNSLGIASANPEDIERDVLAEVSDCSLSNFSRMCNSRLS